MKTLIFAIILIISPLFAGAQAKEERIISFRSDIEVSADSSMIVTETIQVIAAGEEIKRGIFRDFPIAYKDRHGARYLVDFDLLEIKKDGRAEPYHTEKSGNGIRIYIGEENVFLQPGSYEYQIKYKTGRQLGYFQEHDELYWNVTGNGWSFPIDSVTASVRLPGSIAKEQIKAALYTGEEGSKASDGTYQINDGGSVSFSAGQLSAKQGLTIVVGWPKGIVAEPSASQNMWAKVKANADFIVGPLGLLGVLAYYYYAWSKRGRDPKKGSIIAQYESPNGLSPAMLRYVSRMGSDGKSFASSIINLAVKGALSITEEKGFFGSKTYTLTKSGTPKSGLSEEEASLLPKLFEKGDVLKLESKSQSKIYKIRSSFSSSLSSQAGKKYFNRNLLATGLGAVMSIGVLIATAVISGAIRYDVDSLAPVLFWIILISSFAVTNIVFGILMRAYTAEGRKLADEIEGFRLFMNVTEQDRLAFHNPPERTPELFEKMLPYALALGVEHQWAQQFSQVFKNMENRGVAYSPAWYHGTFASFAPETFASTVGKGFAGAVASASAPPGSGGSGFGGGSGGGGGGGGGGGW